MSPSKEELEARQLAEDSREKQWKGESFLKELFLGRYRFDLVAPFPVQTKDDRIEFRQYYEGLERFLREEVDPSAIDESGEYPEHVIEGLRKLGAFGMKVPQDYGGLGLSHPEYVRCMKLLGSYDANVTALLSAHQAIGVPQPVKLFGSQELKDEYLPRCAKGAISAFALTEPCVGSDPAKLATTARKSEDGKHWILDGVKLWCTNGTLAELLVVMARNPETNKINCFVVETDWEGVEIEHRCHFMGLRALANAQIHFRSVKVPAKNLIGGEGMGLKIALVTLNTGRLSLPAATSGAVKKLIEVCRKWSLARVQWGQPVGKHEAVAHKIADMSADAFAMESIADYVGDLADRPKADIRLEAAAAKEWNTVRCWKWIDEALQVRGGRGYETDESLKARGEIPTGIERMLRDCRVNLIFEGSSEIMHLFMAREAVDKHLQVAGKLIDPKVSFGSKLGAMPKIGAFYATWYPGRWFGWGRWPRYGEYGKLAKHLRFCERSSRRLARSIFHGMCRFGPKLEKKQAWLGRVVDIALELYAMTCAVARADRLRELGHEGAGSARSLADLFCRNARRRILELFRGLRSNDDVRKYDVARAVLDGGHEWIERGAIATGFEVADFAPESMESMLASRRADKPSKSEPSPSNDPVAH